MNVPDAITYRKGKATDPRLQGYTSKNMRRFCAKILREYEGMSDCMPQDPRVYYKWEPGRLIVTIPPGNSGRSANFIDDPCVLTIIAPEPKWENRFERPPVGGLPAMAWKKKVFYMSTERPTEEWKAATAMSFAKFKFECRAEAMHHEMERGIMHEDAGMDDDELAQMERDRAEGFILSECTNEEGDEPNMWKLKDFRPLMTIFKATLKFKRLAKVVISYRPENIVAHIQQMQADIAEMNAETAMVLG